MPADHGSGAGSKLPTAVLVLAGVFSLVAVLVSTMSIYLQLKNYRKPTLQRMVIRIMVMVPIYGIASLIALFSLEAAFVIDAIRDIYEAFVIYCFFVLLLSYLGGERSLLILLHGRPPKQPVFPVSLFKREIDVSDPYTFLFLKRGILQYVQVKPILAAVTLILKACGKFNEGDFRANSGYLYVSIIYNTSICLSLYCLAMFWLCINDDLKPFRPLPKFLCVKGILFFSFWQSVGISILVAAGVITKLGPYINPENISVGLNDILLCLEMPFFAFAHMFAFSHTDFIDSNLSYVARMPMYYAFRDAFGLLDVVEDTKTTLRGEGMDYREFEPSEGFMHQGAGRERRIRAGLRYSKGGQQKYWLPRPARGTQPPGRVERGVNRAITRVAGRDQAGGVHAPLLASQAEDVVHLAPDLQDSDSEPDVWDEADVEGGYDLPFGDPEPTDDELFAHSKKYLFGDYNYPVIDISSEDARTVMWDEEERVLSDERGAWYSPIRGSRGLAALERREGPVWEGYGAVGTTLPSPKGKGNGHHSDPRGAHGNIIDYGQDMISPAGPTDVKMNWTKIKGQGSRFASDSASPHLQNRPGLHTEGSSGPSSAGSSNGSAGKLRSPPSMSRNNSGASPLLPSDAVDLVVEDNKAAQKEQTRERRKGEPAVRGSALRKVYKRGFVAHEDGKPSEGEVEIEEPTQRNVRRIDAGEQLLDAIRDESGDAQRDANNRDEPGVSEVEGIIARAGTPPLHARVVTHRYDVPDEDNPWA